MKQWLFILGLVVAAFFAALRKAKTDGAEGQRAEDLTDAFEKISEAKNAQDEVDGLSDNDVAERLRDKWTRD